MDMSWQNKLRITTPALTPIEYQNMLEGQNTFLRELGDKIEKKLPISTFKGVERENPLYSGLEDSWYHVITRCFQWYQFGGGDFVMNQMMRYKRLANLVLFFSSRVLSYIALRAVRTPHKITVYRGMVLKEQYHKKLMDDLFHGQVSFDAFTSTSIDLNVGVDFCKVEQGDTGTPVLFVMHLPENSPVLIPRYVPIVNDEREILLPPCYKFNTRIVSGEFEKNCERPTVVEMVAIQHGEYFGRDVAPDDTFENDVVRVFHLTRVIPAMLSGENITQEQIENRLKTILQDHQKHYDTLLRKLQCKYPRTIYTWNDNTHEFAPRPNTVRPIHPYSRSIIPRLEWWSMAKLSDEPPRVEVPHGIDWQRITYWKNHLYAPPTYHEIVPDTDAEPDVPDTEPESDTESESDTEIKPELVDVLSESDTE